MAFDLSGVDRAVAVEAMRLAAHKLPIETRFVSAEELAPGGDEGS